MKNLIIITALVLSSIAASAQNKIVKTFPCCDQHSNAYQAKVKTIDSLRKAGYVLSGFRVDNTFAKKGHNTQVLTFFKASK